MSNSNYDVLLDAIARNAAVVLSLPSAGMFRHHKSRLLAQTASGFVVESSPAEAPLVDELVRSQQPASVSFKNRNLKVVLATPVRGRMPDYRLNATATLEALLLGFPPDVRAIQRRYDYRVRLPAGAELGVRVWRVGELACLRDRPMDAAEVPCALHDVSVGGLGVIFGGGGTEPLRVSAADRLRIELTHPGGKLLLEGRMRHPLEPLKKDKVRAGVQFTGLQSNLEGRRTIAQLTRIVGLLQREEVRRVRLKMCQPR